METKLTHNNSLKVGFISSLMLTILTIVTFSFAIIAIPPAGPYCPANCMQYPYTDILSYYPRDYYWMYFSVFQLLAYLIFVISIHFTASSGTRIFSFTGVAFALIATGVLLVDYFIQFSVVPISVMKGEREGLALITQYNGHGIFIVLEEIGYIMMSISFVFLAQVFEAKERIVRTIKWTFITSFTLTAITFLYYLLRYGIDRNYRFEVAAITINWLSIILAGTLSIFLFKRKMTALSKLP